MQHQPEQNGNNIRILRLKTGEQIITHIRNSNEEKLFLDRPMKIITMIMQDPDEPSCPMGKEFVYLNNWVEFSLANHIAIPKSLVYAILPPNNETLKAYKTHKKMEDINKIAPEAQDVDEEDGLSFHDMVSNIVSDIICSHTNPSIEEEEYWDEREVNKNRDDYGNDLNDWSPYVDDYCDE